jgi:polyhydroxyalkanoate synthesis regulator phasin
MTALRRSRMCGVRDRNRALRRAESSSRRRAGSLRNGKWEVTFMFETLDRLMLAGLGALTMTRERAETMFDEMVNKGQATRETRTGFVKDVMDSAEKTRLELQRLVSDQVRQTVNNLHLATKDDIERLELKIDQLLARNVVEH